MRVSRLGVVEVKEKELCQKSCDVIHLFHSDFLINIHHAINIYY